MQSTELEVLSQAMAWVNRGQSVVLFTVINTWGSAPRPVGALLAIERSGALVGSVSGGCIEEELTQRVIAGEFQQCQQLTYGITVEHVERVGLPCGGRLQLIAEPINQIEQLEPAVVALKQRQLVQKQLNLATGTVHWHPVTEETPLYYDAHSVRCVYGPSWQLLIIGAGQLSGYVAEFALALNYQVIICDPHPEYAATWTVAGSQLNHQMPDEAVIAFVRDQRSAVVALTHDPKLDDMALLEALNTPAFYIGALGSKANNAKRLTRLSKMGIAQANLARLHAPIGLPIGSRMPAEIAISILAEITAVRHGITLVPTPAQSVWPLQASC
ncbi:MAG: XdhC family protein [Pseudomonadota bacterium]|nr:XdhC family protein [Pseudomonadota bacterium]